MGTYFINMDTDRTTRSSADPYEDDESIYTQPSFFNDDYEVDQDTNMKSEASPETSPSPPIPEHALLSALTPSNKRKGSKSRRSSKENENMDKKVFEMKLQE